METVLRLFVDRAGLALQKRRMPDGGPQQIVEHERWLSVLAVRLTGNATDAQDLVQDTIEHALKGYPQLRPGSNLRAWLATVLNNLFLDRCRRRSREGARVDPALVELPEPPREVPAPWAQLSREDVVRAAELLEEPFRDVFRLHLEGASYDDIARQLGLPRATVGTRLLRARLRLRAILFPAEGAS